MIKLLECIFCNFDEVKNRIFYKDDKCFVVADKYPSEYGHLLVISKEHYENILVAPDELVSHIFLVAKKMGSMLKEQLASDGIVIATNAGKEAGQIIYHLHIHVIPKYAKKREGFMSHKEIDDDYVTGLRNRLKL